jgi:hypothetical protein
MLRRFLDAVLLLQFAAFTSTSDENAKTVRSSGRMRVLQRGALLLGTTLLASWPACAQNDSPALPSDEQPSFMKLLNERGEHNLENESWNAYGQFTYIALEAGFSSTVYQCERQQ